MTATTAKPHPRLSVQAFWLTTSRLIGALLNIAVPILLVRLLAQTEYGVCKQAFLFNMTATNIATLGVGVSAFYFMPRYPERGGQIALNILIYNFIAGWIPLLIVALYPPILKTLFRSTALEPLAVLIGVLTLLTLTSSLVQLMPTALQDVRYSTIFIIGTKLANAILLASAAILYRSVKSLLVASIISMVLCIIVLVWYLHKKFGRFWAQFDGKFFKEQLAYAIPMGAYGLLWVVQKDLDNYFVSASLGPATYAIYSVGWLDVPLISLFLESIAAVMVVRISMLQQQDRKEDIRRLSAGAINRLASIQFPVCAILLVAGHDLIVLFYTRAYERSATIFSVTILLLALNVLLIDPIIRAYTGLRKFVLGVRIAMLIALFASLGPIIHRFGMIGAAITAVAAQFVERIVVGWQVSKTVDASAKDLTLFKDLFKVSGLAIGAGAVAYIVRNLINPDLLVPRVAAVVTCFAALYLAGVYIFRLPGSELMSRERLRTLVRTISTKLGSANA